MITTRLALPLSAALLLPFVPAPLGTVDPLVLEWSDYGSGAWSDTTPETDFFSLRVTGLAEDHAGTWVELTGRVWFDQSFFQGPYGGDLRFQPFDGAPVPWEVSDVYPTLPGLQNPPCILELGLYHGFLVKNEALGVLASNAVREHSEPLLYVPGSGASSERVWDLQYPYWRQPATDYWAEINGHDLAPTLITRDFLIKRLILDRSPGLTPEFFTSDAWEAALTAGVNLQLQGVTIVDGDNDPTTYAQTDSPPPPGFLGGWKAVGTTTELPFMFFGYSGPPGAGYPTATLPSLITTTYAAAGSQVTIELRGLRKDTYAQLSINGGAGTTSVLLRADTLDVSKALLALPGGLIAGDSVKVTGFTGPGGSTALPVPHWIPFVIQ